MSGLGSVHPVNQLIHELAESRRPATDAEIAAIREHVAGVGFNPVETVRARTRVLGLVWNGRIVQRSDRLYNGPIHYLRHVVKDREWPAHTTYDQYIKSLFEVIHAPSGGIALDYEFGVLRLSFIASSTIYRGPRGSRLDHGGIHCRLWMVDNRVSAENKLGSLSIGCQ